LGGVNPELLRSTFFLTQEFRKLIKEIILKAVNKGNFKIGEINFIKKVIRKF